MLVDHSIFRTFNKGSLGMLNIEGPANTSIYSGKQNDMVYMPEGSAIQSVGAVAAPVTAPAANKAERMVRGQRVYASICGACHQPSGSGIPNVFPPLAGSDYLNADRRRAISTVLNGLTGPVVVNGATFNSAMPALGLSDEDVANALTYVFNSWNNAGHEITPAEVKAVRGATVK